jgi:hypothetical protein
MTARKTVQGLVAAAMLSFALAPSALAGPAGDEYLPKVPQSGAHSASAGQAQTGTTTLPEGTSGSGSQTGSQRQTNAERKNTDTSAQALPASSGSGGSGGDGSSGSILLNPIVLLMIAAVIAAAVGMILRRRQVTDDGEPDPKLDPDSSSTGSPRTPDGEIIAGPDQAA